MDNYIRDPQRVLSKLKVQADGSVVTSIPCVIQIPKRYVGRHLASIGSEVYILGFFAILMEERYYAVNMMDAMVRITPNATETVVVNGDEYLAFHFDKNDRVFYSVDLIKSDTLTYYIYDEHIAKGRIPWYFNYTDLVRIFETAEEYAGIYLGNRAIMEMILSTTARNPDDLTQLYKHVLNAAKSILDETIKVKPPTIVPFRSVIWNTSDTTSKLIGAYFSDSITSALVNPSDQLERIEELLRT